jgi:hypothetical protein
MLYDFQIVKFLEFCNQSLVYVRSLKALKAKFARVHSGHYRVAFSSDNGDSCKAEQGRSSTKAEPLVRPGRATLAGIHACPTGRS